MSCQRTSKTSISKILSSSKRDLKESVLDVYCTYFLYLSIGMHVSILLKLLEYLGVIPFHVLSLLLGLGSVGCEPSFPCEGYLKQLPQAGAMSL
jgi:hypothetical protein